MKKITLRFPGLFILIVEDNPINQEVLSDMLDLFGCRVEVAATGEDAVKLTEQAPYDMIFMDLQLPGMNGFEAAKAIFSANPDAVIIALTASALDGDKSKCKESGMIDYVTKPMEVGDIEEVLQKYYPSRSVLR